MSCESCKKVQAERDKIHTELQLSRRKKETLELENTLLKARVKELDDALRRVMQ